MGYHNPNEKPGSIIPCNQFTRVLLFQLRVVPAQGGAEVALKIYIYMTFLIYRTCMRRAPAKPVRACTLRNWCLVSPGYFVHAVHGSCGTPPGFSSYQAPRTPASHSDAVESARARWRRLRGWRCPRAVARDARWRPAGLWRWKGPYGKARKDITVI